MKIYEAPGFPNPIRIRIAAAEKGLTDAIDFIAVDVPNGEHRTPGFLAKNPTGTVPALELSDGTVIAECTAITEYLDGLTGERTLTGSTAKERAVIHMMQRRAENGLLDAVGDYFHHATPGLGPDIEIYQCKDWGEHRKGRALSGMQYLNDELEDRPWIAGAAFSMADITAYAGLGFADFAGLAVPDDLINLHNWRERVADRPSVANAN
ncbi:MAG: glutathione S-transferase [Pseudomonadota bacterium]